jgi:hypothetical protein
VSLDMTEIVVAGARFVTFREGSSLRKGVSGGNESPTRELQVVAPQTTFWQLRGNSQPISTSTVQATKVLARGEM